MISHLPSAQTIPSTLGGTTLFPGVYMCMTFCTLDGILILDAQNDPNAVFQFITAGYLAVSPAAQVVLRNGAVSSKVYWTLGSYAAISAASVVSGTIVAMSYISLVSCTLHGAALSLNAAVSLSGASVLLPASLAVLTNIPSYNVPVALGTSSSFAVLAASVSINSWSNASTRT